MKQSILFLLFFSLLGCTESPKNKDQDEKDHHSHQGNSVELNDGKKWKVDASTATHIGRMERLIEDHNRSKNSYSNLADSLQGEFDMILRECSMKGEAHKQLHNYLLPLKEQIGKLGSSDKEKAENAFEKIRVHLSRFEDYFKLK